MKSSDDISGHFCESRLCNCYCVKNQENCVEILGSYQINITIGLDWNSVGPCCQSLRVIVSI